MTDFLRDSKALVTPIDPNDPYSVNTPAPTPARSEVTGRELDALVAEKVMGLALKWDVDTRCPECSGEMRYCGARSWCYDCHEWRHSPYREYSSDIVAAWDVIEKLNEKYHARIKSPFTPGDLYFAGFTPHGSTGWNGRPDYEGSGETAPLAICRAALSLANAQPLAADEGR